MRITKDKASLVADDGTNMLYRAEYKQEKGQWHLEYLRRSNVKKENTHGWNTIFPSISDEEFKLFYSFIECHKNQYQLDILDLETMKDLASLFSEFVRHSHDRIEQPSLHWFEL